MKNKNELKDGEYYVGEWEGSRVIFKKQSNGKEPIINTNNIFKYSESCCNGGGITFRLASKEERDWLDACIKADKFIPLEEAITEFKKDDYIVILKNSTNSFKINYCFKQRESYKYIKPEFDNHNSKTNGLPFLSIFNKDNWRYATPEEIAEYERIGKPYNVTTLEKPKPNMEEIQKECKKRFPIGCTFINPCNNQNYTIEENDIDTYKIIENQYIDGGESKGYLYYKDKYAELIETPEVIVPEYVEYIDTKYKGKIVKIEDWKCGSYCKVLFADGKKEQPFKHLVKPSTKEAYEAQNFKIKSEDTEIKVGDYIQYLNKEFYTVESDNPVYLFYHSDNTSKVYCEDLKYLNSLKYFKKVNKNIITENFKQDIGLKPSNFNIEVGDVVEVISPCQSSGNKKGFKDIVTEIGEGSLTGFGKCNIYKIGNYYEHISGLKLIKKHSNTTIKEQVDISSPQVTSEITVPRVNSINFDQLIKITVDMSTKSIKIPKLEISTPEIKQIKINSLKSLTI